MPATKPDEKKHVIDYRPKFKIGDHEEILKLTAEFTQLDHGNPVPKNQIVREVFLYQMRRLRYEDKMQILTAIRDEA